jgi:hypothetical protein
MPASSISSIVMQDFVTIVQSNQLMQFNAIINQLVGVPADQSLFGQWTLVLRHRMALELELAFLDPQRLLAPFSGPVPTLFQMQQDPSLADRFARMVDGSSLLDISPSVRTEAANLLGKQRSFASSSQVRN